MIILWRGWGIIALLYATAAVIVAGGLEVEVLPKSAPHVSLGILLLLAAVATWFTGVAMNRRRPQRTVDRLLRARRAQLDELVTSGRFSLGPGQPPPVSVHDAQRMSDDLFAAETAATTKGAFNRHTLFWIPMQYVAFVWVAAALWSLGSALFGSPS